MKTLFPRRSLIYGAVLGLVFGLFLRGMVTVNSLKNVFQIMSFGFVFFGPLAIGVITISMAKDEDLRWRHVMFWPWLPVLLGCVTSLVAGFEGLICVAMYLPIALFLSSVGGWIAWMIKGRKRTPVALFSFAMLPLLSQVVETQLPQSVRYKEVHSQIRVSASADKVWREIKSVRTIERQEMPDSWVHRIGFPRPLDAVVDREGLGGVRKARFERGLVFDETIDQWDPPRELGFTIHADEVPPTALDEHVTIGGAYFDVLHGQYSIEPVGANEVVLHLRSRFRLSTNFNFYSGLWTEWVMQRIQGDILGVVQARAVAAQKI